MITKPKPLTMGALRTWLKSQDPTTIYNYNKPTDCLMARFGRAQGYDVKSAGIDQLSLNDGTSVPFRSELDVHVAYYRSTAETDYYRTYGGALAALEAYMKEQKGHK